MNDSSRSFPPVALAALLMLLSGCSSNFTMPWEQNMLDPSRIATREPLEIPPDLNTLPTNDPPEEPAGRVGDRRAGKDDSAPASARSILFKGQEPAREAKPLGRDEQERLPGWLGDGAARSKK
ncbi:hypothetical protein SIID45300_00973 [Candidatus Magnetaquicoccaceae bacterium FCR-1]|uniref:DUF3035 domain-containing protein n=1 Tax=Candidatus Magnetaquiglobus chichijimensis TaxID=3141448 RepID=A0ABQ0C706_9PROT